MRVTPLAVVATLVALVVARFAWRRRYPRPFPTWLTPLLHMPAGRRSLDPDVAAELHGIGPDMQVLELGSADGYLTDAAQARAGPAGRLISVDLQLGMLRKIRRARGDAAPPLVCARAEALPFTDACFDLAFVCQVLGEVRDKPRALAELARVVRPGGTLAVTEALPDPDYVRRARLLRLAGEAGFEPGAHFGGWRQYTQRCVRTRAGDGQ